MWYYANQYHMSPPWHYRRIQSREIPILNIIRINNNEMQIREKTRRIPTAQAYMMLPYTSLRENWFTDHYVKCWRKYLMKASLFILTFVRQYFCPNILSAHLISYLGMVWNGFDYAIFVSSKFWEAFLFVLLLLNGHKISIKLWNFWTHRHSTDCRN